ncbi:threonine-phosphate decarboxylase [Chitinimonas naiadis]
MAGLSPQHGGDLQRAIAAYGGTAEDWLDCSSGIAPYAYPLPAVPTAIWQRLPEQDATLLSAAAGYYGTDQLLALPGSQAAISLLPQLRRPGGRVAVIAPAYAEHAWQWQQHGHAVLQLAPEAVDAQLPMLDVLVVVNPNNPSARQLPAQQLLAWREQLATRGGWLIVDEAFADIAPAQSLLPHIGLPGLIILRSVGKFFGLAGIRLGFAAAETAVLRALQLRLGPWAVSAPAQWAGALALADSAWQQQQQARLQADSHWLLQILAEAGLPSDAHIPLLHWCPTGLASEWQAALARQRIWSRRFDGLAGLRLGLPDRQRHPLFKQRLLAASAAMRKAHPTLMESL